MELAFFWQSLLVAAYLVGLVVIVRPLKQSLDAHRGAVDTTKKANELLLAALQALRPHEVVKDAVALRDMAKMAADETVERERRRFETLRESDRQDLEGKLLLLGGYYTNTLKVAVMFMMYVPAAQWRAVLEEAKISGPVREIFNDFIAELDLRKADLDKINRGEGTRREGLGLTSPEP